MCALFSVLCRRSRTDLQRMQQILLIFCQFLPIKKRGFTPSLTAESVRRGVCWKRPGVSAGSIAANMRQIYSKIKCLTVHFGKGDHTELCIQIHRTLYTRTIPNFVYKTALPQSKKPSNTNTFSVLKSAICPHFKKTLSL